MSAEAEIPPRRGVAWLVQRSGIFERASAPPLFFLLTLCSVFYVGLDQGVEFYKMTVDANLPRTDPRVLWQAAIYSFALRAILGTHEMGHWIVSKLHGVKTSLPIFIPNPLGLGTFGAIISMDELPPTRRALLRIGAAGPLAGGIVALIVMVIAIPTCPSGIVSSALASDASTMNFGASLGMYLIQSVVAPQFVSASTIASPLFMAAWLGFLLTTLNLFPIGQLDGGHVAYAIVGERMNKLSRPIALGVMSLSIPGFLYGIAPTYFFWGLLAFVAISWHPPVPAPEDELSWDSWLIAAACVVLFVLTFMLVPLWIVL